MSSLRRPRSRTEPTKSEFTERQLAFIREYLVDLNATEAARRAGYSKNGACSSAQALLRNPRVVSAIEAGKARRAGKNRVTADRVMEELGRMAFANMRNYLDWGPDGATLKPAAALSPSERAAVSEIVAVTNATSTRVTVKLHSKLRALEDLAKHLGLFAKPARDAKADEDDATLVNGRDAREVLRERFLKMVEAEAQKLRKAEKR